MKLYQPKGYKPTKADVLEEPAVVDLPHVQGLEFPAGAIVVHGETGPVDVLVGADAQTFLEGHEEIPTEKKIEKKPAAKKPAKKRGK